MDLLAPEQVKQIRDVFHDLSETFSFPVTIRRTNYDQGAFRTDANGEEFQFNAIREFVSQSATDRYRNDLGPDAAHEIRLFIHWQDFEDVGLVDGDMKVLLDHNDIIVMEGEEYEIISFDGIAQMSKKPSFVYLLIKRKWAKAL